MVQLYSDKWYNTKTAKLFSQKNICQLVKIWYWFRSLKPCLTYLYLWVPQEIVVFILLFDNLFWRRVSGSVLMNFTPSNIFLSMLSVKRFHQNVQAAAVSIYVLRSSTISGLRYFSSNFSHHTNIYCENCKILSIRVTYSLEKCPILTVISTIMSKP